MADLKRHAKMRMMNQPVISVLITTYNSEEFLSPAIDSILNQTFIHFEILIADDGSSDATPQLLEQYKRRDPRINIYLHKNNKGQAQRLNELLEYAKGEYIARMDADDISYPKRFNIQLDYFKRYSEMVLLGTQMKIWFFESNTYTNKRLPTDPHSIRFYAVLNNPFSHPSVMLRKEVLIKMGGYPLMELAQDYQLWSNILFRYETRNTREILMTYRRHSQAKVSKPEKIKAQQTAALEIGKNNLTRMIPKWSRLDFESLYSFLKIPPITATKSAAGWKLFYRYLRQFYSTYPDATQSLSFKLDIARYIFEKHQLIFTMLPWHEKRQLLKKLF